MVEIRGFKGVIYNQDKVKIEDVISPPYDVITDDEREALLRKSPYNIVRLILGKEKNWIEKAAAYYKQWLRDQILTPIPQESIFPYYMEYTINGIRKQQKGFIARVRIESFDKGIILPHEKTFSKTVSERLRLLKVTQANFSQVYGVYDDPEDEVFAFLNPIVQKRPPFISVKHEGVLHRVWQIEDKKVIEKVKRLLQNKKVIIADGHHRYRTALAYKEEMAKELPNASQDAPFHFVSMYLSNLNDDQLTILPIHRLLPQHSLPNFSLATFLDRIKDFFEVKTYTQEDEFWQALHTFKRKKQAIGCYCGDDKSHFYIFVLKSEIWAPQLPEVLRKLDVMVLTKLILKRILGLKEEHFNQEDFIEYVYTNTKAIALIRNNQYRLAFLLNSTPAEQLKEVVLSSYLMPRKSTCFYPKLLTGLVINDLQY